MLGADAIPYDKNKKELRSNEKLSEDTNSKYMQTTKKKFVLINTSLKKILHLI